MIADVSKDLFHTLLVQSVFTLLSQSCIRESIPYSCKIT